MDIYDLPAVNAVLNSISTVFIITALVLIRMGKRRGHAACMVIALITSAAFLTCYLIYHFHVASVKFTYDGGMVRVIYFSILISHILLAIAMLPLIILTVVPAIRAKWNKHRKFARWTAPIWLYVSVTGVLIYLMLYVWYPSSEIPV